MKPMTTGKLLSVVLQGNCKQNVYYLIAMAETDRVTATKKEKDPRRVEAGKRLAAISKEAKERKMRERIANEAKIEDHDCSWGDAKGYYGYVIGTIGLVVAIGSLYYARMTFVKDEVQGYIAKLEPETMPKHVDINKKTLDSL